MRHLRTVNKNPVTGEKRISKKGDKYRFECHHLKIDKLFRTLDEAVMYRNEVFNEIGYSE